MCAFTTDHCFTQDTVNYVITVTVMTYSTDTQRGCKITTQFKTLLRIYSWLYYTSVQFSICGAFICMVFMTQIAELIYNV